MSASAFGVEHPEPISKSAKSQVARQLKLVEDSHGAPYRRALASGDMFKSKSTSFDPKRFLRGPESNGPKKAGDSVKALQLRLAGAQARKNVR